MRIKIFALGLMLAFFASAGIVLAKQSKVIELKAKDGAAKIATIHVNDQSLLIEFNDNSMTVLLTGEAVYTINHKDKTYHVDSYDDLQAAISRKLSELAKAQENIVSGPNVEFKLTEETDTISGSKARKLIKMSNGKPEAEIWVSSDLMPLKLRAAGERMRAMLPADFYKKVHGNPGLPEIILSFGIPLKIVGYGPDVYQANIIETPDSDTLLQVPAGYRKVEN